ncbi:hypothetical protein VP237E401_P0014 [Vibrio phage 237E40-1]|nr:hypothetical protein VP237E401_P0014 [Vibrio phage 237E40-1]
MIDLKESTATESGKVASASLSKLYLSDDCKKWTSVVVMHIDGLQLMETKVINFEVGGDPIEKIKSLL